MLIAYKKIHTYIKIWKPKLEGETVQKWNAFKVIMIMEIQISSFNLSIQIDFQVVNINASDYNRSDLTLSIPNALKKVVFFRFKLFFYSLLKLSEHRICIRTFAIGKLKWGVEVPKVGEQIKEHLNLKKTISLNVVRGHWCSLI